jgi:hypothetical protein
MLQHLNRVVEMRELNEKNAIIVADAAQLVPR